MMKVRFELKQLPIATNSRHSLYQPPTLPGYQPPSLIGILKYIYIYIYILFKLNFSEFFILTLREVLDYIRITLNLGI
jgi:hypothetical protein